MFSTKEAGVGGRVVVVPRARVGVGGLVGRRERRWEGGVVGCGEGWMYWFLDISWFVVCGLTFGIEGRWEMR